MARPSKTSDELDLAIIGQKRRYEVSAKPFLGATILVVGAWVDLDLRPATPGPTGIEVHAIVIAGRLRLLANPNWRLDGEPATDAPLLRVAATARLGKVLIDR